jgi:hypothetical protein
MLILGHNEYGQSRNGRLQSSSVIDFGFVTQGRDWGYMISRTIGHLYPEHCKAPHVNMLPFGPPQWNNNPLREKEALETVERLAQEGSAYNLEQSTKPQTLGYALVDSPVALLAWIYEERFARTDDYPWTDEEVLTWISLYWFSSAGASASIRIYYEFAHDLKFPLPRINGWIPGVKYGIASFPKEVVAALRLWARAMGNIVHESESDRGGHFAAWEKPDFIVGDLRQMFGKGGGAYAVVKGKEGY